MKKLLLCALTALMMAVILPTVAPGSPAGAQAAEEDAFIAALNQVRAGQGLPGLVIHDELTGLSRTWTQTMADAGEIFHANPISAGLEAPWLKLGENVGVGPSVSELMDAFVASPGHYANIIDPEFTHVGVGVVWVGNTMYTTHRFMKMETAPPPTTSPPPPPPPPTTTATVPPVAPVTPPTTPPTTTTSEAPETTPPTTAPARSPVAFAEASTAPPVADAERVGVVLRTLFAIDA